MITFVINEGSKMDASLRAMKAHIARCTELFPVLLESSKDGETSYSFLDLTPYDMVNQRVEEKDQVEDIMALTASPISTTKVVVPNATPNSFIVGKETLDGSHVAKASLIFQMVFRTSPPLAPLALGFPRDN